MIPKEQNSNQTDVQFWIQLKAGSEFALSKLVKKYFNHLQNYAYKFSQDKDFVKDCVQEVFIEIWSKRDRISVPDSVKAYLLSSVRLKVFREISRQKINRDDFATNLENSDLFFEESFEFSIIEQEKNTELELKVKNSMDSLPERQREVIYLQFYQNMSREEIAQIMNINSQSVSNLIQRAFQSLRQILGVITFIVSLFKGI
jgi:RNA polymerase sigma factor (sigma-70 family)